jgi:hypothetical protein
VDATRGENSVDFQKRFVGLSARRLLASVLWLVRRDLSDGRLVKEAAQSVVHILFAHTADNG